MPNESIDCDLVLQIYMRKGIGLGVRVFLKGIFELWTISQLGQ